MSHVGIIIVGNSTWTSAYTFDKAYSCASLCLIHTFDVRFVEKSLNRYCICRCSRNPYVHGKIPLIHECWLSACVFMYLLATSQLDCPFLNFSSHCKFDLPHIRAMICHGLSLHWSFMLPKEIIVADQHKKFVGLVVILTCMNHNIWGEQTQPVRYIWYQYFNLRSLRWRMLYEELLAACIQE